MASLNATHHHLQVEYVPGTKRWCQPSIPWLTHLQASIDKGCRTRLANLIRIIQRVQMFHTDQLLALVRLSMVWSGLSCPISPEAPPRTPAKT